jgi:putative glutamine amidotransferase
MPNLFTWMRAKDEKWFAPFFAPHPELAVINARNRTADAVSLDAMDGLLLTGGADISPTFLHQPVPDSSVIEEDNDPARDQWEFDAVQHALACGAPIFAICKGMQLLNVALGGTLKLDIAGHNLPGMKDDDIQPLRTDTYATHQLEKVNSSHHQAVDRLGDGFLVEAWCATDDIIEQVRLRKYSFALAVQYHPERGGERYRPLFEDFFARVADR